MCIFTNIDATPAKQHWHKVFFLNFFNSLFSIYSTFWKYIFIFYFETKQFFNNYYFVIFILKYNYIYIL